MNVCVTRYIIAVYVESEKTHTSWCISIARIYKLEYSSFLRVPLRSWRSRTWKRKGTWLFNVAILSYNDNKKLVFTMYISYSKVYFSFHD